MPPKSADKTQRVAIDTPNLGNVDDVPHPPPIDPPPKVRQDGICPKLHNEDASSTNGEIMVRSNYVQVSKIPQTLHAYTLKFTRPAKDQGRLEYNKRREIRDAFQALIKEDVLKFVARKVPYVTDFKTLWTTTPIDNVTKIGYVHNSKKFKYIQPNGKTIDNLRVELTYVDHLADIQQILQTKPLAKLPEYIRALNATVAQCIEEHQKQTGKEIDRIGANRFYVSNGYVEMRGELRAGRGYYTSIRPGTDGPLLNINPATSAFLPSIKVSDFIKGMGAVKDKRRYVSQLLQGATLKILYIRANYEGSEINYNSEAARLKVFTQFGDYDSRRQKFYELEDAVVGQPRRTKDSDLLGTTVHDYFTQKARISFPPEAGDGSFETWCVNVGKRVKMEGQNTNRSDDEIDEIMRDQSARGAQWIPACLLQIVPGQMVTTTLDSGHTSEMIRHALRLPAANFGLIEEEGLEIIGVKAENGQQPLASANFTVGKELIEVPATTLGQPILYFKNNPTSKRRKQKKQETTKMPELGHWSLRDVEFAETPSQLGKLHMLALSKCFDPAGTTSATESGLLQQAYTTFRRKLEDHGISIGNGTTAEESEGKVPPGAESAVKHLFNNIHQSTKDCSIILIPEKNYQLYATWKRHFDFSGRQVLFATGSKFIEKGSQNFMSNLALKVNMKFGGVSHHLNADTLDKLLGKKLNIKNNTIVLGADISHCGAGGKEGSPSVACVVGSVDNRFMSYPGSMRLQRGGQENIEHEHLKSMVKERLHAWRHAHDPVAWPTHMLFYRDGISESQFKYCIDHEISTIKDAYRELCDQDLQLTFVVCGKRHNTRFYATEESQTYPLNVNENDNRLNGNLKPGLLVTKVVTNPTPFNFFLQSHKALKGTARSAHYHVLEDGMNLGETALPELTMMLCYTFGRSTTGVSYAAPAYIADRLCERGRTYLREWNADPEMDPKFEMPSSEKDQNGKNVRVSQEEIDKAKADLAKLISVTPTLWGKYDKPVNFDEDSFLHGQEWLNPWHPILNDRNGMFWM